MSFHNNVNKQNVKGFSFKFCFLKKDTYTEKEK